MNKLLKVLIVEDSEDDVQLLLRELKKGGYKPTHKRVETATAMKKALKEHWDIIISDYKMPKFSGPDALRVLHASNLDIPFIIVSGSVGEDAAVETLKEGAHDFITKMNLARLVPAIEREIEEFKIRKAHKQAEEALQQSEQRYQTLALMSP
ncbi:MAG: response regulator, partial [Bacteroidota bacterium]|nr:response regulator [Bacteroidota bacterium]